jgi:hypothetical protein
MMLSLLSLLSLQLSFQGLLSLSFLVEDFFPLQAWHSARVAIITRRLYLSIHFCFYGWETMLGLVLRDIYSGIFYLFDGGD